MLSRNLEKSLHRALAHANERRHEYATLEHLLLALTEDQDAIAVLRACSVDVDRLRRDMDSPEIADEIIANLNLARALKIAGTPGFIVAGKIQNGPSAEIDFPKLAAAARALKN